MHRLLFALTLALAGSAVAARAADAPRAPGDPLESADCRRALEALRTQEAAAVAEASRPSDGGRPRVPDARFEASRRQAAQACLASRADPPTRPQRFAQPPIAVSPIAVVPPRAQPPLPIAPVGPPPKAVEPPRFILSCDPGGCWANDGSRLNRVGPNLWGSRGMCSVQGTLLQCP